MGPRGRARSTPRHVDLRCERRAWGVTGGSKCGGRKRRDEPEARYEPWAVRRALRRLPRSARARSNEALASRRKRRALRGRTRRLPRCVRASEVLELRWKQRSAPSATTVALSGRDNPKRSRRDGRNDRSVAGRGGRSQRRGGPRSLRNVAETSCRRGASASRGAIDASSGTESARAYVALEALVHSKLSSFGSTSSSPRSRTEVGRGTSRDVSGASGETTLAFRSAHGSTEPSSVHALAVETELADETALADETVVPPWRSADQARST